MDDRINRLKKTDIEAIVNRDDIESRDGYTRGYSQNTSKIKLCTLYNYKGQGNYGMCWAASVASIVNYIKGSNISAATVCKKMNIGYNDGATPGQAQLALMKYGVDYNLILPILCLLQL